MEFKKLRYLRVYFWVCWVCTAVSVFLQLGEWAPLQSRGLGSHCGGLSHRRALGDQASIAEARGLLLGTLVAFPGLLSPAAR